MSAQIESGTSLRHDMGSVLALVIGTGILAVLSTSYVHGALVLFVLNAILVLSYRTITTMGGWSFAHVAIMGVGAYAVAILSTPPFDLPVLLCVVIGGILAGLVAIVLSWPVLRTRQYYFFLSTFAAGEALRQCFIQFKTVTGGTSGIAFIPRPAFIDDSAALPFLWLALAVFLVLALAAVCFDASETGVKIRAVGEDETLSASLGLDAWGLRATAFVLGSVGAGIAGGLLASYNGIVAPNDFGAALMFKIVASCIVGGTKRAWGPLLGLIFLTVIEEMFRAVPVYVPLIWGGLVILVTLYAPGGLESLVERLQRRIKGQHMLEVRGLTKTFGSITAVDGIDMQIDKGAIHGLIGPNGSGKSTTMNLISGTYVPSVGEVKLQGTAIGGLPSFRVARMGVVRTFQLTRVYSQLSLLEATRIGALAGSGSPWNPRFWRPFRSDHQANEAARNALHRLGLEAHRDRNAGSLPSGMRRILSIATALAASPKVLLLDEPLAGLNASEKAEVADRIQQLRQDGLTILLVEHDVRSIMRLSDRITVINFGKVIATGTPAEISRNDDVIAAYLGHRRQPHAAN